VGIRDQTRDALLGLVQQPVVKRTAQGAVKALADKANYHVVRGMADPAQRPQVDRFYESAPWMITSDYVRQGTLELVCQEVRDREVPGALGELGVFRGDFAWLFSQLLPGRRIDLFDTFSGFEDSDVEQDQGLVDHFLDFSATDPESVRARFDDPSLIHTHVGWFPESASAAEDVTFALVSIDADLYAPVLSGLDWFWPRLSPGGYILVHDFNNGAFGGAKKAVREFQDRTGVSVVPVPDWGGTAILTQPRG
jgi:O-methyltransferase